VSELQPERASKARAVVPGSPNALRGSSRVRKRSSTVIGKRTSRASARRATRQSSTSSRALVMPRRSSHVAARRDRSWSRFHMTRRMVSLGEGRAKQSHFAGKGRGTYGSKRSEQDQENDRQEEREQGSGGEEDGRSEAGREKGCAEGCDQGRAEGEEGRREIGREVEHQVGREEDRRREADVGDRDRRAEGAAAHPGRRPLDRPDR